MSTATFQGSLYGSFSDVDISSGAAINASKLMHQYEKTYCNESATTAVSEARTVHVVRGQTGTVLRVAAGSVVANIGAATVTVDLLKNGASILSAVITLNNGVAAYAKVTTTSFSNSALVAGDVLELKTVATAGGGTLAKGVFAQVELTELAA